MYMRPLWPNFLFFHENHSFFNIVLELYDYKQYFKVLIIYSRWGT